MDAPDRRPVQSPEQGAIVAAVVPEYSNIRERQAQALERALARTLRRRGYAVWQQ